MTVWPSGMSVRSKLMVLTMTTSFVALALSAVGLVALEAHRARQGMRDHLVSAADLVGATAVGAVQFGDVAVAAQVLNAFAGDPAIDAARIDRLEGPAFASFTRTHSVIPGQLDLNGTVTIGDAVVVSRAIQLHGQPIAAIRVQGSLENGQAVFERHLWVLGAVLALSFAFSYALSRLLTERIAGPILRLAGIAEQVGRDRDFARRGVKESDDEIGQLVERFNDMLAQIERRDAALRDAQAQLETRVRERTVTLEREVDERRRTENRLLLAKAAAEEANVAKSTFLANMSHELRTPLNAIIGYSEMLEEDAVAQGQAHCAADLRKVTGAGRQLLALITDVLDLSKIEAGRMDVTCESFDAAPLFRTVLDTSDALARARGNTVTADGIDTLGTLYTDATKLQQVLLNLTGNACKFTSHGRVHLAARREPGPDGDCLVVDVQDTGIGITSDQLGRLFREFSQADASTTRRFGGTGLGLAISQRLCQLLGGAITVESRFGHGSTFTVRVPVHAPIADAPVTTGSGAGLRIARPARPRVAASDAPSCHDCDRAGTTILIVDDDATHCELLSRVLARGGFRVLVAGNAHDGLEMARTARPDAIVLDLVMPDGDGWSLLETASVDVALSAIPIVVLSIVDDPRRSLSLGAVEHLLKPAEPDVIVACLRRVLAIDAVTHGVPAAVSNVEVVG